MDKDEFSRMKEWIDNATYKELLSKWRFELAGSPWFQYEIGDYYVQVINKKRIEVGHEAAVRASKEIGWSI